MVKDEHQIMRIAKAGYLVIHLPKDPVEHRAMESRMAPACLIRKKEDVDDSLHTPSSALEILVIISQFLPFPHAIVPLHTVPACPRVPIGIRHRSKGDKQCIIWASRTVNGVEGIHSMSTYYPKGPMLKKRARLASLLHLGFIMLTRSEHTTHPRS